MYNISFCSNLNIDKNLEKDICANSNSDLLDEYKKFIQNEKIAKMLGNDTIELKKSNIQGHNGVELNFINSDTKEKIEGGIFAKGKKPQITSFELIRQTCDYIGYKFNIKPKFSDTSFSYPKRAIIEVLKKFQDR